MAMVNLNKSVCSSCGGTLAAPEPVTLFGRTFVVGASVCAACAGEADVEPKKKTAWERLCPKLYQKTDIARLENGLRELGYEVCWLRDVLTWQYGSQGLVISGPTGVGKSRVMWLLLERLLDQEHRSAVLLNAVAFRTRLQLAARDGTTEEFVRRLMRTDLLYWDDLGQMHLTGAVSEMLLHVVEERSNSEMPILATTQYSGEGIDAQFERKEMGKAIRRRLNEFCRVVVVRSVADQTERSIVAANSVARHEGYARRG
jgi:nucleoside-triphosphatase THEP1